MPSINRVQSTELEGRVTKNKGVHSEGLSVYKRTFGWVGARTCEVKEEDPA